MIRRLFSNAIMRTQIPRIVYINGQYVPEGEARVSIFDRGFLMADGVYELTSVLEGRILDFEGHATRLKRSLDAMDMKMPMSKETLLEVHRELIQRNKIDEGTIYLQITRGSDVDRDFVFPDPETIPPTVVMFHKYMPHLRNNPTAKTGLKIISIDDLRWGRRDIKTIQLLYASMGKTMAKRAGADDAWMVQEGFVTEGTRSNVYIVKDGKIITRALSYDILHGITRAAVLQFAREAQMEVVERSFTIAEAQNADEAFVTSASTFVLPVVDIDGHAVGTGTPGPIVARLRELYIEESMKQAI